MKNVIKKISPFFLYFMIVAVFASYYLFNKNGIISTKFDKDLTFIFLMVLVCFVGCIANFIINTFFIGEFFRKLRQNCNSLTFCAMLYILFYNIDVKGNVYSVIEYLMLIVLTYSFFDTFRELDIDSNIVYNVFLRSIFCFALTFELYKMTGIFCNEFISKMYFLGFFVCEFFLILSVLRYIPNAVFESFSEGLFLKYCMGCFAYVYLKLIRPNLLQNNWIYIVEWAVICVIFGIYFYSLIKNIKKESYYPYEPLWGKHKQTKVLMRNIEFAKLSEYIDLYVEKGEKTALIVFLFQQLFALNVTSEDAATIMKNLIEYKEENLPRYSSVYKLKQIIEANKNERFLIVESTIKKINGIMEEKL